VDWDSQQIITGLFTAPPWGDTARAMSQENVEQIVRDGYDAFNRGDLEACLTTIDPGIQWWPATDELIIEPYRGHDGYRRLFAESREGVPDIQAEVEELLVVGDQVIACVRFWGRGRESGAPVEVRETHLARLRDGKIIEVHEYREKHEALEAVGLSE
jgi:ketosteroid isomerase-like protein